MKTLVITAGDAPLPPELEDVITRGSTAVERRRAGELPPAAALPEVDRVVFWSPRSDAAVRQIAGRYARAEDKSRKEAIVFVTTTAGERIAGVSETELFVWPEDKDRLTMAFMTGA
jgi:hypothetical protein